MFIRTFGDFIRQLGVGRNSLTKQARSKHTLDDEFHGSSDCKLALLVYYLSEVFKTCLESFWS